LPDRIETVDDVVARLTEVGLEIERDRGPADGVARFNVLYLTVTKEVDAALKADEFAASEFVARLDVIFAGLYFAALDADRAGTTPPKAWKPLFEQRAETGIAAIQFALAGMNAHINHDLSHALIATWHELGKPDGHGPVRVDYQKVNTILERVESSVKTQFETEDLAEVDHALGNVDDLVAIWSVVHARDQAWTTAEAMWALRNVPGADEAIETAVDGLVGFAGHGLLHRIGLG
jgi:hypothetical protein